MQLFRAPWLRCDARTNTRHTPRRIGAARRIALLLQAEAANKAALTLQRPTAAFVVADPQDCMPSLAA